MKKNFLLALTLVPLTLLASCNREETITPGTDNPSSSEESKDIEKLSQFSNDLGNNNYTVDYLMDDKSYSIFHNQNYVFDTYYETGVIALKDNTVYNFTTQENKAFLSVPFIDSTRDTFDKENNNLTINADNFIEQDGYLISDSFADAKSFATMVHYDIGEQADNKVNSVQVSFDENNDLEFSLISPESKELLKGIIYNVGTTTYKPAQDYIDSNTSPEEFKSEDNTLSSFFKEGSFTALLHVNDIRGKVNAYYYTSPNYWVEYENSTMKNGSGSIVLSDDVTHEVTLKDDQFSISYDYEKVTDSSLNLTRDIYESTFNLGRVDYTKFEKIADKTFFTKDYISVKNLASYLFLSVQKYIPNGLKITLGENKNATFDFYLDSQIVATVEASNVGKGIDTLDEWISTKKLPSLEKKVGNEKLVEATKNLKDNFTISFAEGEAPLGIKGDITVTPEGRYEDWESAYYFDRSSNYIKLDDDTYAEYFMEKGKIKEADYKQDLTKKEFEDKITFSTGVIDFSAFDYISTSDEYYSNSTRYADFFFTLGAITRTSRPTSVYLKIQADNTISVRVTGTSNTGIESDVGQYVIKNINASSTPAPLTEYINSFDKTLLEKKPNTELSSIFKKANETSNYSIQFLPTSEDDYTTDDIDYYTENAYYSYYYKDGLYKTKTNYFYKFDMDHQDMNEDNEPVGNPYYYVKSEPVDISSINQYNGMDKFTTELIDSFYDAGETDKGHLYYSLSKDVINYIFNMEFITTDNSQIKSEFLIQKDGKVRITIYTREPVTNEGESTMISDSYVYEEFSSVLLFNVGTTSIPSEAKLPTYMK